MSKENEREKAEAFLLWWMPIVAVIAPLGFAAWKAVSANSGALREAAIAFAWPGVLIYLGAIAVLWAGWKIDLE